MPDAEKVYLKFRSLSGGVSEVYKIENTNETNSNTNPTNLLNGSLIKTINDYKVYEVKDGRKYWLDITVEEFEERGYDWNEVYVVNEEELGWYEGEDR